MGDTTEVCSVEWEMDNMPLHTNWQSKLLSDFSFLEKKVYTILQGGTQKNSLLDFKDYFNNVGLI